MITERYDADGNEIMSENRINRFGRILRKTSIDELPQIINILKGDMSLIGPRPLLPQYLPLYSKEQARRHEVRPGLSGWAQVNGRNAISWSEKFKFISESVANKFGVAASIYKLEFNIKEGEKDILSVIVSGDRDKIGTDTIKVRYV